MSITGVAQATSAQVGALIRKPADADGDGKTGVAALDDVGAAAHAAGREIAREAAAPAAASTAVPGRGARIDVKV
jgi:hypothetical protein